MVLGIAWNNVVGDIVKRATRRGQVTQATEATIVVKWEDDGSEEAIGQDNDLQTEEAADDDA